MSDGLTKETKEVILSRYVRSRVIAIEEKAYGTDWKFLKILVDNFEDSLRDLIGAFGEDPEKYNVDVTVNARATRVRVRIKGLREVGGEG